MPTNVRHESANSEILFNEDPVIPRSVFHLGHSVKSFVHHSVKLWVHTHHTKALTPEHAYALGTDVAIPYGRILYCPLRGTPDEHLPQHFVDPMQSEQKLSSINVHTYTPPHQRIVNKVMRPTSGRFDPSDQVSESLHLDTLLFFLSVELSVQTLQVHLHDIAHNDGEASARDANGV